MIKDNQKQCSILLFINSGSGGGVGKQLVQIQNKLHFQLDVPQGTHHYTHKQRYSVDVYLFNMKKNKQQGFQLAKKFIAEKRKCLGVICGGDGTVTWVIMEMDKHQVPTSDIPFAVIPLGTGNDFSQSLGWGATSQGLIQDDYKKLKKLFIEMLRAKDENMDVWQVSAVPYPHGKIQKYENQKSNQIQQKKISKPFVNYFSFGLDGKVGYSFDKHRTTSRLGNLTVYGFLGLAKGLTKTQNLHDLVDQFKQLKSQPVQAGKLNLASIQSVDTSKLIFSPQQDSKKQASYEFNQNILALNINSFMGGAKDIWKNSSSKDKSIAPQQDSSDGKIEFVSFPGSFSIGMQKTVGGFADRVYQGQGPFVFNFKQYPFEEKPKHRTYLQIDGQFLRFTHPKSITIQKSPLLKGKFRVLKRQKMKKQNTGCCGCFG